MAQITTAAPLVAHQLTADQLAERVAATREALRERMSCPLTDEELDQGPDVLANLYASARSGLVDWRGARVVPPFFAP